jgi:hypothetical protein
MPTSAIQGSTQLGIITVFEGQPLGSASRTRVVAAIFAACWLMITGTSFAQSASQADPAHSSLKENHAMPSTPRSPTGEAEMKASRSITTKILAIGSWTAKATPETRTPVMPFEARDTLRLQLAGKIDQWFAKTDGSGAVFLMNVTDVAEAKALLEVLPLGKAGMMTFQLIPMGPLWPLGLMLRE